MVDENGMMQQGFGMNGESGIKTACTKGSQGLERAIRDEN
jgi:hypothetical protein